LSASRILIQLLITLVAARLAAELSERIKQPAVIVEIAAGIVIGPFVLGLVHQDEVLKFLGELGAILLLFEVGMHTSLVELRRVGGDALRVAALGIIAPMALGFVVLRWLGIDQSVAIFLAGGITATSVGITARVFGDLRAISTPEARTVLGAAVADDVAGLLVLTIVVSLVAKGGITLIAIASILAIALGFIGVSSALGLIVGPRLLREINARSRTDGTLMALGLGFAVLFSVLAAAAKLASIVGAFIAGLSLSNSEVRDELHRRLVPLGHLLIPVFFLAIGIETDLGVFADPAVIGIALALCVVAIAGKMIAGLGVKRGRADRLLVGIAMIPRGEVGLIFAGIGLAGGILDARSYGILVLVVLVTTLITPPWIRRRIQTARKQAIKVHTSMMEPEEGWILLTPDEVELNADPPDPLAAAIGLEVAVACASRRPGASLLDRLSGLDTTTAGWNAKMRESFFKLLRQGNERSWKFLEVTGLLSSLLPSLQKAVDRRQRDPFELDPSMPMRWDMLENLRDAIKSDRRAADVWVSLPDKDLALLSALAISAFGSGADPAADALALARTIGLENQEAERLAFIVEEARMVPAAASRLDGWTEDSVLELAAHLGEELIADILYLIAVAANSMESWERERLDELFELIRTALGDPILTGIEARDLFEHRRQDAIRALEDHPVDVVRRHLEAAPRRYLIAQSPEAIARHLRMTDKELAPGEVRIEAERSGTPNGWVAHVALVDRRGVLSSIAGAFANAGISIEEAFVSTWNTGIAIDVFRVTAPSDVDWQEVQEDVARTLAHADVKGIQDVRLEGQIDIDNLASPWYTILQVIAHDRVGLLHKVATALSSTGLQIHMANLSTQKGTVVDTFYVTSKTGAKLDAKDEEDLRAAFAGRPPKRRRLKGILSKSTYGRAHRP